MIHRCLVLPICALALSNLALPGPGKAPAPGRAAPPATSSCDWSTFQANARHDGHVPISLRPSDLEIAWSFVPPAPGHLRPVAAAGGLVFCPVNHPRGDSHDFFALDAADGRVIWSKTYHTYPLNPPCCAYGNVYISKGMSSTYLSAYEAGTGKVIFVAHYPPLESQVSLAPTPLDGQLYVNGAAYWGAHSFRIWSIDAFTGALRGLSYCPDTRMWTPAVDSSRVYVYPNWGKLDVGRLDTGLLDFTIRDPGYHYTPGDLWMAPLLGGRDDLIIINNGRLVRFDLAARDIAWQLSSDFQGQPSLAHGAVYALDGGILVAVDQISGARLWSWSPASGPVLEGRMVVTDTHLFVCCPESTYAVDLASHREVWSRPVSGYLALANRQLYVAHEDGFLTAVTVLTAVVADAGPDTTVCPGDGGATRVRLDGRGSAGETLAFRWSAPGIEFDDPTSPTPTGVFPAGTTVVTLVVDTGAETATDSVRVTVADAAAPDLALRLEPAVLWPPDHRLVPVHATVTASDECDPGPAIRLLRVACSEPDADAIAGAEIGTADFDLLLRAERSGGEPGRVYTVCYEALDSSGNRAERCGTVTVPHDRASLAQDKAAGVLSFAAGVLPNPARRGGSIRYDLPAPGFVRLRVYDLAGRLAATLVEGEVGAGRHQASLDAGGRLSAGVYLYRLEWQGRSLSGKVLLLE